MKIKIYIVIGILALLYLSCTNPFSTRSPEDPDLGGGKPKSQLQTDPDSLLSKLRSSFGLRDVTDYQECLADSFQVGKNFVFIPENREINRLANWNLQDEANYFNKLINSDNLEDINITFNTLNYWQQVEGPDTLQIEFSYQIEIKFITRTELYQGTSIIKILKSSSSLWYIFYWRDFYNSNDPADTWSTLKANYRY
jgi:hypothetical protein